MLAGYDEAFKSTQQLLQCVRPGILLDAASVPSVQMTNRNGQVLPLNRYILDYWGHGQKQALVQANGLREGVLLWSRSACLAVGIATCNLPLFWLELWSMDKLQGLTGKMPRTVEYSLSFKQVELIPQVFYVPFL